MTEKLDNFNKDILSFLEKREPERVLWREIAEGLFPSYKFNYKNERVFGVALTQKLNSLKTKGLIIKEGDRYGTLKSKSPIGKKSSTEKPSKFVFFEWLKDRSEKKRLEQEKAERERLAYEWAAMENIAEAYPEEMGHWKDFAEKEKKNRKELGLE